MTKCSKCGATMFFGAVANGKRMPLNVEPAKDGNVVIRDGIVRVLRQGEEPEKGELRYVSHFATCTAPKSFRKPHRKGWEKTLKQHEASRRERQNF
jgi:hypothetical protein